MGLEGSGGTVTTDDGTGASIVLVDDSPIEIATVADLLSHDHHQVFALDGDQGRLSSVASHDPEVIVVNMSGDGERALRHASQLRSMQEIRQVPILVIGDEDQTPHLIKALELGAND